MTNKIVTSPSERVLALSDSFKGVLKLGQQYVDLLDQLAKTDEAEDLLAAASQLIKFDLNNAFIDFPQHYQAADYYMLFMGRLLEMNSVTKVKIAENARHQFEAKIEALGDDNRFKFTVNQDGAAAFTEEDQQQPLFYLNLQDRLLQFNNRALVNYFIVYALKKHTDLELRDTVKPLVEFADELAKDLDFTINLGILDTGNDQRFKLEQPDLQLTVIDRLFVKTAETDYMLMNLPHNSGAELLLDQNIKLDLSFDPDDYSQEWAFQVKDPHEQVSFFDLLLHYNLVRQWYLNDREALAVRSDRMIPVEKKHEDTDETIDNADEPADEEDTAVTVADKDKKESNTAEDSAAGDDDKQSTDEEDD
jgi:hypothetical protein